MKNQIGRFVTAGAGTVGLYVGGVWFGTEILDWPVRPVNAGFFILATLFAFALNYRWVFASQAKPGRSLLLFSLLRGFGIILNLMWVEAGLRFTSLYPWIIAASFFGFWALFSFTILKRFIFNR